MTKNTKATKRKVYWGYNYKTHQKEYVAFEEFISRIALLVNEPVRQMWEFEGDMMMSDFQKLNDAKRHLERAIEYLNENGATQ